MRIKSVLIAAAIVATGCGSFQDTHANFKEVMAWDVGHRADAEDTLYNRYPERAAGEQVLDDGDIELIYDAGFNWLGPCTVYWRVDKDTNLITDWRFEGDETSCVRTY